MVQMNKQRIIQEMWKEERYGGCLIGKSGMDLLRENFSVQLYLKLK